MNQKLKNFKILVVKHNQLASNDLRSVYSEVEVSFEVNGLEMRVQGTGEYALEVATNVILGKLAANYPDIWQVPITCNKSIDLIWGLGELERDINQKLLKLT